MRQFIVSAVSWQQLLCTCHHCHEGEGGGGKGGGGGDIHYCRACMSTRCGGQCEHQQNDVRLKCLGQMLSDMSDTSGVTDPHLESGMFLSGSGIIVWCLSGHRLFSSHQTAVRYTPDSHHSFHPPYISNLTKNLTF